MRLSLPQRPPATVPAARTLESAEVRGVAYALFSRLMSSPHDAADPLVALPPGDLVEACTKIETALPYPLELESLHAAGSVLGDSDAPRLAAAYSSIFEVGSDGAAVPVRSSLSSDRPDRTREEIVRFYEHFGYATRETLQWTPDHLAIELEFMHYLTFGEARAQLREEMISFQLGQLDFIERQLLNWIPAARRKVEELAAEPYHRALFQSLETFLMTDRDWQRNTVEREDP